jgi:hypothetical protein
VVMLADQYDYVIGGDPDRDSIDLAVLETATGTVHGHRSDRALISAQAPTWRADKPAGQRPTQRETTRA